MITDHPFNIAGYVASNIQSGIMKIFHWHDTDSIDLSGSALLDVRKRNINGLHKRRCQYPA